MTLRRVAMFTTKPQRNDISDKFIKHDSKMLQQIYGTNDVLPYWVADMDFPVAHPISQALARIVEREKYAYEFDSESVFKAISDWNKQRHGLDLNPSYFVQVPGVLSAIALMIREWSNKGDGVLIQVPVYHQFRSLIESAGRKVVANPLTLEDGQYQLDFDDFEAKLREDNVKIVLLCNPHNPVGRVWTQDELAKLVAIVAKYNVVVISDEIHADIVFEGHQFNSILTQNYDNVVSIIGSPAKNFGLNSIANGYLYTENQARLEEIKSTVTSMALDHGNTLTNYATIAAYTHGQAWFEGFLAYSQNTIDWVEAYIAQNLPQIKMFKPQGTNQIWFDFSGLDLEPEALKSVLFTQAKMGLTPGGWFGEKNPNFYRMNIASPLEQIEKSFYALSAAIKEVS